MFYGRKQILISIIALPILSYSQSEELEKLVLKRIEINSKILSLQDSLKAINFRIDGIKANAFEYVLKESNEIYVYSCRPTTRLRKEAWPSSEIIKEFQEQTDVILLGFEGDYLLVDTPYGKGFIHKTFASPISSTIKATSANSYQPNTESSRSTRKSTYRTYYRGPRGGCYYINSNGNKTYVARSLCN